MIISSLVLPIETQEAENVSRTACGTDGGAVKGQDQFLLCCSAWLKTL